MTVLKGSFWVYVFSSAGCGSCSRNIIKIKESLFLEKLGIKFVDNIKSADCILISGFLNYKNLELLRRKQNMKNPPCYTIAHGNCSLSGGLYKDSYNIAGDMAKKIKVDYYVPGCPASPGALINSLSEFVKWITARNIRSKNDVWKKRFRKFRR